MTKTTTPAVESEDTQALAAAQSSREAFVTAQHLAAERQSTTIRGEISVTASHSGVPATGSNRVSVAYEQEVCATGLDYGF